MRQKTFIRSIRFCYNEAPTQLRYALIVHMCPFKRKFIKIIQKSIRKIREFIIFFLANKIDLKSQIDQAVSALLQKLFIPRANWRLTNKRTTNFFYFKFLKFELTWHASNGLVLQLLYAAESSLGAPVKQRWLTTRCFEVPRLPLKADPLNSHCQVLVVSRDHLKNCHPLIFHLFFFN